MTEDNRMRIFRRNATLIEIYKDKVSDIRKIADFPKLELYVLQAFSWIFLES